MSSGLGTQRLYGFRHLPSWPIKADFLGVGPRYQHLFFFQVFFWPCHIAFRILTPQPAIKSVPPAVEAQSLKHWTKREVSQHLFFSFSFPSPSLLLSSLLVSSFFFPFSFFLSYNLITFTVYLNLCIHHHHQFKSIFIAPRRYQCTPSHPKSPPPFPTLHPWLQATSNLPSVHSDSCTLDISYKWNHTIRGPSWWLLSLSITISRFTML